jgi:hypothetical protein
MDKGSEAREEWRVACKAEHEAWALIENHMPGEPGHDPEAWKNWQATLRRARAAMKRLTEDDKS